MYDNETDIIPIIARYLHREASDLEKQILLRWLEESDENRRFFSDLAANDAIHRTLTDGTLGSRSGDMILRLQARMDEDESRSRTSARRLRTAGLFSAVLAAAAAVVLLVVFSLRTPSRPVEYFVMENTGTEVRPCLLEDGTRVWLRPGSRILYNVAGLADRRLVELSGQAYFDVSRDEARPMTVSTPVLGVRVLGTAFAVNTGVNQSDIVLERGSVRLLSTDGNALVTLVPGQKATFLASTGDVTVEPVYAEAYVTQHYNLISMSEVTLPEILTRLESRFSVRLRSEATDGNKRYTLNYLKTDSLEDVLSMVEYLTGAKCEIIN